MWMRRALRRANAAWRDSSRRRVSSADGAWQKGSRRCLSSAGATPKFAFVGAGKMAEAMIAPLSSTEILGAVPEITFFDLSCAVAKRVEAKYAGATRAASLEACVEGADVVMLCTKPQNCDVVFPSLGPVLSAMPKPPVPLCAGINRSAPQFS